jgi:hypothetical protein
MAIVRNHVIMLITIVLHAGINHFGIFFTQYHQSLGLQLKRAAFSCSHFAKLSEVRTQDDFARWPIAHLYHFT